MSNIEDASQLDATSLETLINERVEAIVNAKVAAAVESATKQVTDSMAQTFDHELAGSARSLLADAANEGAAMHVDPGNGYEFALIPMDKIDLNPLSERTEEEVDPESDAMKALANDIETRGSLIRPLLVYRKNDRYVLVKGYRRFVALQMLEQELAQAYILPGRPPLAMERQWVNGF